MIEANNQDYDEKTNNLTGELKATIASMMDQIKTSKYSQDKRDKKKAQYPTTVVPANNMSPPLEGGNPTKIGGMWNLKHEISSPKFYELLVKTELKGNNAL